MWCRNGAFRRWWLQRLGKLTGLNATDWPSELRGELCRGQGKDFYIHTVTDGRRVWFLQSLTLPWHARCPCSINCLLCHFCGFWLSPEVCCFVLGKKGTSRSYPGLHVILDAYCVFKGISFKYAHSFWCPLDPQRSCGSWEGAPFNFISVCCVSGVADIWCPGNVCDCCKEQMFLVLPASAGNAWDKSKLKNGAV